MKLATEPYQLQAQRWPAEGRHILAHHDEQTVVVYQAYRPSIGSFAVKHGYFDPTGAKLERRAIQLGLRGGALEEFERREVIDTTEFVDDRHGAISKSVH